MQERLQWIKLSPAAWVDWEPVRGGLATHAAIAQRYPRALCHIVESVDSNAQHAAKMLGEPWWRRLPWAGERLRLQAPLAAGVQMVWANMALHMAADPQALIALWQRWLAVDGFLMFSCLGPDTLRELREVCQNQGWPAPAHEFTDMHDWGDMLVSSGFAEPVMDMERVTLTFDNPLRALQELRGLGRNLHVQRFAGLRGRGWRERLGQLLVAQGDAEVAPSQRVRLTFEIIYGHAIKPAPRLAVSSETVLSLDEMRQVLARRRATPGAPT